jgi:hypothetical protein
VIDSVAFLRLNADHGHVAVWPKVGSNTSEIATSPTPSGMMARAVGGHIDGLARLCPDRGAAAEIDAEIQPDQKESRHRQPPSSPSTAKGDPPAAEEIERRSEGTSFRRMISPQISKVFGRRRSNQKTIINRVTNRR